MFNIQDHTGLIFNLPIEEYPKRVLIVIAERRYIRKTSIELPPSLKVDITALHRSTNKSFL